MCAKIRWTELLRQHVLKLDAKWFLTSSTRAKCCMILSINRIMEKLWEAINLSTSSTCMNLEAVLLLRLFLCQLKSKDYSCLRLHVCMCWSTVVSEVDFAHMLFWMIMMVCVLWSLGLKIESDGKGDTYLQYYASFKHYPSKLNGTESQRTCDLVSCYHQWLDTQVFVGVRETWVLLLEISWNLHVLFYTPGCSPVNGCRL